jgi:hypothetical protein
MDVKGIFDPGFFDIQAPDDPAVQVERHGEEGILRRICPGSGRQLGRICNGNAGLTKEHHPEKSIEYEISSEDFQTFPPEKKKTRIIIDM